MADQKLTALTNSNTVDDTDLVLIVDDVAGTPTSEKRTVAELKSHINTGMQAQPAEGAFVDGDKTKLDATIAPTGTPDGSKFLRDDGAWTSIGGGGDMLAANNLSDLTNTTTARTNLGVDASGTDNAPTASTTVAGKVELATNTETTTGTDDTRAVTPAGLKAVTDALPAGGISNLVEDTTPQLGGTLDPNGNAITGYLPSIDEDDMTSNSASHVPTQQSVKAYVDTEVAGAGGGGGGNPYGADLIVAASGGDYTTLSDAITNATAGDVIYVQAGTYTEAGVTSAITNLRIIGANRETTTCNLGSNAIVFSGNGISVQNIGFTSGTGSIQMTGARCKILDCKYEATALTSNAQGQVKVTGVNSLIDNLYYTQTSLSYTTNKRSIYIQGNGTVLSNSQIYSQSLSMNSGHLYMSSGTKAVGNHFEPYSVNSQGSGVVIDIVGERCLFTGNTVQGFNGDQSLMLRAQTRYVAITGNTLAGSKRIIELPSSGVCVVTGNYLDTFYGNAGYGVYINGNYNTITGNIVRSAGTGTTTAIYVASGKDYNTITGNTVSLATTGVQVVDSSCDGNIISSNIIRECTTSISDSGTGTVNANNVT